MNWAWKNTRWVLDIPYERQLDIESVNERQYQLWYRRTHLEPRSLLIGVFHTVEETKAMGKVVVDQLLHHAKLLAK